MATGSNYSLRLPAGWHKPGLLPMAHLRGREAVKSSVSKRSIVIAGHKTSVSLDEFWKSLKEIAGQRSMTLAQLVAAIDGNRQHPNLSSAIRLFVLGVYRDQHR
jgi:predicted DNA-binding ribbon-helix-helix protein